MPNDVFVCVTARGTNADGCLLGMYPLKPDRVAILAAALPWCLGPTDPATAAATEKCFTDSGGTASSVSDCNGCHTVAAALGKV